MPALETSQTALSLAEEVAKGAPSILVMWYMLRDVRGTLRQFLERFNALELKVASDQTATKLAVAEERLKELQADLKEAERRLALLENQMPAVWAKIGDRPEDLTYRLKGTRP